MKYFGHDTNARRDPRIRKLLKRFKGQGYAVYFGVNEMIAEKIEPPKNLDCLLEEDIEQVADDLNESIEDVKSILTFCVEIGLLTTKDKKYQNTKILKRKDEYTAKKLRTMSGQERDKVGYKERKGNEMKGKERTTDSKESSKGNGFAGSGMTEDQFKAAYPQVHEKLKQKPVIDIDF